MLEGWCRTRLGELITVKHGFAFAGEHFVDGCTRDVLATPGNFAIGGGFKLDRPKYYDGPVDPAFVLDPGDLIVTMTDLSKTADTLGYSAVVPDLNGHRLLHNQRVGRVLLRDPTRADLRYLAWVMRSSEYRGEVLASASGTTVKHTAPSRIEAYTFRLPPLNEQRSIAYVLGALDDKIDLNRRMIETLEETARAIFKRWFVDFDPVRAKMQGRPPAGMDAEIAALLPPRMVQSEIGEIPEGWPVATIGEIADVVDCMHSRKPERRDVGRPMIQLANIRSDGLIDFGDEYLIGDDDYVLWTSRIEASPGDCVITNVGRVGAVAQMPKGARAALGRNMTAIRCRADFPFPTVLLECLLSDAMRSEISLRTDAGTILDALNVRSIPRLRFVRPSEDGVCASVERLLRPIRERMEYSLEESRTLAQTRDVLLPRLLCGEIRIRDAERLLGSAL